LFELQYCGPAAGMIDSLDEAEAEQSPCAGAMPRSVCVSRWLVGRLAIGRRAPGA
jgi:hypothetical protein